MYLIITFADGSSSLAYVDERTADRIEKAIRETATKEIRSIERSDTPPAKAG